MDGKREEKTEFMASGAVCKLDEVVENAVACSRELDKLSMGPCVELGLAMLGEQFSCGGGMVWNRN